MKNKNKKQILFGLVVLSCLATVLGQEEKKSSYLPVAPQEQFSDTMTRAGTVWRWSYRRSSRASTATGRNASWRKLTKPVRIPKPCGATPPSNWWWINRPRQADDCQNNFAVIPTANENQQPKQDKPL